MVDYCGMHQGPGVERDLDLDDVMKELPERQAGAGRHRCAYVRGDQDERKRIVAALLRASPDELAALLK